MAAQSKRCLKKRNCKFSHFGVNNAEDPANNRHYMTTPWCLPTYTATNMKPECPIMTTVTVSGLYLSLATVILEERSCKSSINLFVLTKCYASLHFIKVFSY